MPGYQQRRPCVALAISRSGSEGASLKPLERTESRCLGSGGRTLPWWDCVGVPGTPARRWAARDFV